MTDTQVFANAVAAREVVLHSVDFDCRRCGRNFDYEKIPKRRGKAVPVPGFVLAHLKACRFASTS